MSRFDLPGTVDKVNHVKIEASIIRSDQSCHRRVEGAVCACRRPMLETRNAAAPATEQ